MILGLLFIGAYNIAAKWKACDTQIWAPHIANEQRVARQNGIRLAGIRLAQIIDKDRDRFSGMSRRFESTKAHAAEFNGRAILKRRESVFGACRSAEVDDRAQPITQFQMPSHEVSVKMSQEDVLNTQSVFAGKSEVTIYIALRIDDCGYAGLLIADDIGGMGQTTEIKLLKDQASSPLVSRVTTRRN